MISMIDTQLDDEAETDFGRPTLLLKTTHSPSGEPN